MMMGAIRTPSVHKMQEVDKNILAARGTSTAKVRIAIRAHIDRVMQRRQR